MATIGVIENPRDAYPALDGKPEILPSRLEVRVDGWIYVTLLSSDRSRTQSHVLDDAELEGLIGLLEAARRVCEAQQRFAARGY